MSSLASALSEMLMEDVMRLSGRSIRQIRPFATGHGADIYLVDLDDGRRVIVKRARVSSMSLDIEGWMLKFLAEHSKLPVPEVYCAEKSLLIMDYIPDSGRFDRAVEEDAARHLAALHSIKGGRFGLDRDTAIGPLRQPNEQIGDWRDFFRDFRLMYMARQGMEEGSLPSVLLEGIEKLSGRLDRWIGQNEVPRLIHGDVWSGNILTAPGRVAAFIDPAIYYADPEIELAFIDMLGTFSNRFFKIYSEISGIKDGYEERRDIYALYPLLVHARIYGGAYIEKADSIVRRLVG